MTNSSMQPLVAVLIRSMDRDSLSETLRSVEQQSFSNTVVLVLNAKGDQHRPLADSAFDVRLLSPGAAYDRASAANFLLEAALEIGAEYAIFVDDDDLINPDHLSSLVSCLESSDAVVAYSSTELQISKSESVVLDEDWSLEQLYLTNFIPIHSAMFRLHTVAAENVRFDSKLAVLEDWDFWLQLSSFGAFIHIKYIGAVYRVYLGQSELSEGRDFNVYRQYRERLFRKYLTGSQEKLLATLGTAADTRDGLRHELRIAQQQLHAEAGFKFQLQNRLEGELQLKQKELENSREEVQQLRAYVSEIKSALSYRAAAPLRWLGERRAEIKKRYSELRRKKRVEGLMPVKPPAAVDVIVPVYRGLEETRLCIESVLQTIPLNRAAIKLTVINDASPEPEVTHWLRQHAAEKNYCLLENEENLGFVQTVNRGMQESETDVVLLNSDTEVANNWLDKMVAAAYQYDQPVSTVTPFSNNATIFSFPKFCEDNTLESGFDLAAIDNIFAHANAGQRVEVPTAMGFCMYITRSSLADVGLFDAEKFGKGYGEENEFCLRASAAGWSHIHALDAFVWHKGSVSFGTDVQRERVQHAMKVIDGLYPSYQSDVHRYISEDPAQPARLRAQYQLFASSPKKRGLIVTHDRAGGVERNINELIEQFPDIGWCQLKPAPEGKVWLELGSSGLRDRLVFDSISQAAALDQYLRSMGFAFIHWHHTLGLPSSVRELLDDLSLPGYFSVHDYYTLCPQISLTESNGHYCQELGLSKCETCVKQRPVLGCTSVEAWRESHHQWLQKQERLIAPSQDCADRVHRYFPELNVDAVPHLEMLNEAVPQEQRSITDRPLRVAIIGGISKMKGADLLESVAVLAAQQSSPLEFKVFGHAYRALSSEVNVTGAYRESELESMVESWKPDILWYPALWPETYSYTLSTAINMAMPVVATNLGAFSERLNERPNSWILSWQASPQKWVDWFVGYREGKAPEATRAAGRELGASINEREYYQSLYASAAVVESDPSALLDVLDSIGQKVFGTRTLSRREKLVMLLYRVRSSRLVAPLVRRLPTNLQTYVKNRILGYRT